MNRRLAALGEADKQRALECFRAVLRERSLKMSKVRESIARAALDCHGHFTVEELVRLLHAQGLRDAHVATVYRAIPFMVEAGLIQPALVAHGDGQRYELAYGRAHHGHLVCTGCGVVVEYQSEALEALQHQIAEQHGFVIEGHIHEVRGRCRACRRAGQSSARH